MLHGEGTLNSSSFGDCIAPAGDLNFDGFADLAVGAPSHDPSNKFAGRVVVLSGLDGSPLFDVSGPSAFAQFGDAVDAGSDVNGDFVPDVLIGASLLTANGAHSGRTYLCSGADGTTIHYWNGEGFVHFMGNAVAFAGDIDGDAANDVLTCAYLYSGINGASSGKVYAYSSSSAGELWTFEGEAADDNLGIAVARLDDVDGDGVMDVAVSAPFHDGPAGTDSGAVYVLSGATGALLQKIDGEAAGDEFGAALASAGDTDGDGAPEILVGAPLHGSSDKGRAYLMIAASGAVLRTFDGDEAGADFGRAIAGPGDVDGDGVHDVVIGAPLHSDGRGLGTGAAFLYDVDATLHHVWVGRKSGDQLGAAIAGLGDWNGDARNDIAIGAPVAAGGGTRRGEILVDGGTALMLGSDLVEAFSGDTLSLTTRSGTPGKLGLLAAIDVSGTPIFVLLHVASFDASGAFALSVVVPPGLAGLDVSLLSFGQGPVRGTVASGVTHLLLN